MNTVRRSLPLLALLVAFGSSTAHAGLFDDEQARKQIADLTTQVRAQHEEMSARIAKLEADNEQRGRAIIDLSNQIEALRTDIAKLRGQLEVLLNDADTAQKRQKDFYVDLDNRLRSLEKGGAGASAGDAAGTDAGGKPGTMDAAESKVYESALNQFKLGNYQGAIAG